MHDQVINTDVENIVVSEVFPHSCDVIWKVLANGELMGRWLMPPNGFVPQLGTSFTFQTTPGGKWDGTIHCKVLEVVRHQRLSFSWIGGDEENEGYGSKLDTTVTFTLSPEDGGTRILLVHSGFKLPKNNTAFEKMSEGWKVVVANLRNETAGLV